MGFVLDGCVIYRLLLILTQRDAPIKKKKTEYLLKQFAA